MSIECSECERDLRMGHDCSRRCQAIVEDKGYPTNPHLCSRTASEGSRYCTQHRRTHDSKRAEVK